VHNNVVRAVGGSALGDSIYLGTLEGSPQPVQVDYDFSIDPDWRIEKCRVKAILFRRSKKSGNSNYIDAIQTGYITTLPAMAVAEDRPNSAHFPAPNPANRFVRIVVDAMNSKAIDLKIVASDGRTLDLPFEHVEDGIVIDTRSLGPGVYQYVLQNGEKASISGRFEVIR
jgi:hypothetical protein